LAVVIGVLLAVPSASQAATVSVTGGVVKYAAVAGRVSNINMQQSGATVTLSRVIATDEDPLTIVAPCTGTADTASCPNVGRVEVNAGDMSDRIEAAVGIPRVGISVPVIINGEEGNDALVGGAGEDTLDGGAGDDDLDGLGGDDNLLGRDGDDILKPNSGKDTVSGGDGIDTALFGLRNAPVFSLDNRANDGESNPAENDLIASDVENVDAGAFGGGVVTMTGDPRANKLSINGGRGDITGGEGSDVLEGGTLDDVIHARDGSPDTVICGAGTDTVEADTLDIVSPSCENVAVQPSPGGPFDDRPPLVAWGAPGAGDALSANNPTLLTATASDDRGVARVQFWDDDRLVCEDNAAPFECAYQPRGADVGRDTLSAIAIDGANQTTSVVRAVTVRRFSSSGLGLLLKPSRDRKAPYSFKASGRLLRPNPVSPSQGCSGEVTITAKSGTKTVKLQRIKLSRTCDYSATVKFGNRKPGKLRLIARFGGNDVMAEHSSPNRTIRLG
jgi:hypothetical protein